MKIKRSIGSILVVTSALMFFGKPAYSQVESFPMKRNEAVEIINTAMDDNNFKTYFINQFGSEDVFRSKLNGASDDKLIALASQINILNQAGGDSGGEVAGAIAGTAYVIIVVGVLVFAVMLAM
jgi:hypothetical protein